jgi:3-oxoadipate enol-lactonase
MATFKHNDLTFWYTEEGAGEPLVLIPGVTGDERLWRRVLPKLSATRRVISFDNRDAGKSSVCEIAGYGPADMAGDVLALFDHLGLRKAHVMGHSLGGQIAQEVALRAPDRVNGLILANTWSKGDGELDALLTIREAFSRELSDEAFATQSIYFNFGPSFFRKTPIAKIVEVFLASGARPPREAVQRQIAAARKADTLGRLGAIQSPTLVVWGDEDRDFPRLHAEQLMSGIPGARQICIFGSGHCPMIDRADDFADAVLAFLEQIEAMSKAPTEASTRR